jgi:hypothetical protein
MWMDLGIVALLLVGVYCFIELVGWRTRLLTSRTERSAEDTYDRYAGLPGQQRLYAMKHGGAWTDDGRRQP